MKNSPRIPELAAAARRTRAGRKDRSRTLGIRYNRADYVAALAARLMKVMKEDA